METILWHLHLNQASVKQFIAEYVT